MPKRFYSLGILTTAALAAGASAVPAFAQTPQTIAELATYAGADRQTILEEGARSEGKLSVYTVGTQIEPVVARFEELYPYIEVEITRESGADIARRAFEEYSAGTYIVDIFEQASAELIPAREAGLLQAFASPETTTYAPASIEPQGRWVSIREGYIGLGFNTTKVSPDDAPKTYADLLDPRWKGRMAIAGSTGTSANWVGALVLTMGEDFVRQLGQQDIRVYKASGRAIANLVVSGEVDLSPTIYSSHAQASKAEGAPIEWLALGPVPVTDTSVALAAKSPHPHAALLYIDFVLSEEAQFMYRDLGYLSSRGDLPFTDFPAVEKIYFGNRPDYVTEFEHWSALFQEVFLTGEVITLEQ